MGDLQGNPFIGNPFMQKGKKVPPVEGETKSKPRPNPPIDLSLESSEQLSNPPVDSPKKTVKSAKPSKSSSKSTAAKSRSSLKRKRSSQPPTHEPPTVYSGNGYKVQVLAKIPMPSNTNVPSRDYLWFAVYPIIPRVGDCLFHDGRYFRVDAVFLYENTNAGWCADLEVSYYTRRH